MSLLTSLISPGGNGTSVGAELGYAERATADTTTNATAGDASANLIAGLAVPVTGIGRAVEVEFYCTARHSVVDGFVGVWLTNNGTLLAGAYCPVPSVSTSRSNTLRATARVLLADGAAANFEVGKFVIGAGTGTYDGSASNPMWMAVTQR